MNRLRVAFAPYWQSIQHALFPQLECVLGSRTEKQQQLVQTLEVIRIEQMIPPRFRVPGRPPKDRAAMARAFVAKARQWPTQGRVRRSPCPGPWRLESDVSLHVRRARTHRRPARTPGDITSAPPATPLGACWASVTHPCPGARSATRRNNPTSTSRRAAGPPEPASSRRSRANGCSPAELRAAPSRKPQEFRKRLEGYTKRPTARWRAGARARFADLS